MDETSKQVKRRVARFRGGTAHFHSNHRVGHLGDTGWYFIGDITVREMSGTLGGDGMTELVIESSRAKYTFSLQLYGNPVFKYAGRGRATIAFGDLGHLALTTVERAHELQEEGKPIYF